MTLEESGQKRDPVTPIDGGTPREPVVPKDTPAE